jgi:hypothetical protein
VTFLDIGPYDTGPLEVRPVLDDPMVFLAPADSPEAARRANSMADGARLPMIGTRDPDAARSSTRRSTRPHLAELWLPFRQPPNHPRPDRFRAGLRRAPTARSRRKRPQGGSHPGVRDKGAGWIPIPPLFCDRRLVSRPSCGRGTESERERPAGIRHRAADPFADPLVRRRK